MKKDDRSQAGRRQRLCFAIYLGFLFYLVFFQFGRGALDRRVYRYNLIPFQEIRRYLSHFQTLGLYTVINLAGNVAVFIPFGLYLPFLAAPARKGWSLALYACLFSLMIESVQLLFRVGSFDVDDILLNTLGGLTGFVLYRLLNRNSKTKNGIKTDSETKECGRDL